MYVKKWAFESVEENLFYCVYGIEEITYILVLKSRTVALARGLQTERKLFTFAA